MHEAVLMHADVDEGAERGNIRHDALELHAGLQVRDLVDAVRKLAPGYMPMGSSGMADMGEMAMPAPDNTLPMMSGDGQFGPAEMGGMFTVIKIREGLAANDYRDPGSYKHPEGAVAYEFKDEAGEAPRQKAKHKRRCREWKCR